MISCELGIRGRKRRWYPRLKIDLGDFYKRLRKQRVKTRGGGKTMSVIWLPRAAATMVAVKSRLSVRMMRGYWKGVCNIQGTLLHREKTSLWFDFILAGTPMNWLWEWPRGIDCFWVRVLTHWSSRTCRDWSSSTHKLRMTGYTQHTLENMRERIVKMDEIGTEMTSNVSPYRDCEWTVKGWAV